MYGILGVGLLCF